MDEIGNNTDGGKTSTDKSGRRSARSSYGNGDDNEKSNRKRVIGTRKGSTSGRNYGKKVV